MIREWLFGSRRGAPLHISRYLGGGVTQQLHIQIDICIDRHIFTSPMSKLEHMRHWFLGARTHTALVLNGALRLLSNCHM